MELWRPDLGKKGKEWRRKKERKKEKEGGGWEEKAGGGIHQSVI